MAHVRHRGLSAADVLRTAEGERMERALSQVKASPDGAETLLDVLCGEAECTPAGRKAAFDALMSLARAASVAALFELAGGTASADLDLYGAARTLKIGALLDHCGCGEEALVAEVEEAGMTCVGDVVRYCCDADDADGAVDALALELFGVVERPTLRRIVAEARALCEATARLPAGGDAAQAWKRCLPVAWEAEAEAEADEAPAEGGGMAEGEGKPPADEEGGGMGEMLRALGGGGGGGGGALGVDMLELLQKLNAEPTALGSSLALGMEMDEDLSALDEEEGPLPGTRSVAC